MKLRLNKLGPNTTELQTAHTTILFSYETPVAAWIDGRGYVRTDISFSSTTTRHINKWLEGITAKIIPHTEIEDLVNNVNK